MGLSMEFGKCSFSRLRDPHSGYASIELFPNPIQLKNNLILSRFASFCGKPGMAMLPLAAQLHGEKREFLYCGPYLVNMAWTVDGLRAG